MSHKLNFPEKSIFVCDGSKCGKHKEVRKQLKESIRDHGLKDTVELIKIDCTDRCKEAPIVCFQPQNRWFSNVSVWQVQSLFNELILEK
ncbi:(2Fe-2S) ferredoxin domain-containing protein [Spirosoma sp. KCTC 42546]|uniref:(2Fe-2S) ferredoxin domain-containing protein n=1 Tax=Spirosoma sp. KCTC 42546 TaxID=2520506 RepID=UPI00115839CE|nr:(2Fe-2S) ferredoxin domain-containing protein [Spirosoma sp. KCTC 42546]QDK81762.1 (2Fe-2S) ferredoxin domain-containing protein [Spirosoma sp. KCTC 42546]